MNSDQLKCVPQIWAKFGPNLGPRIRGRVGDGIKKRHAARARATNKISSAAWCTSCIRQVGTHAPSPLNSRPALLPLVWSPPLAAQSDMFPAGPPACGVTRSPCAHPTLLTLVWLLPLACRCHVTHTPVPTLHCSPWCGRRHLPAM